MAGGNDYGIPHNPDRFQDILNQSWPAPDVARRLHDRPDSVAVRVRVVWADDGEEWLDGTATRWHGRQVCVLHSDPRARVPYSWVDAGDVQRR